MDLYETIVVSAFYFLTVLAIILSRKDEKRKKTPRMQDKAIQVERIVDNTMNLWKNKTPNGSDITLLQYHRIQGEEAMQEDSSIHNEKDSVVINIEYPQETLV